MADDFFFVTCSGTNVRNDSIASRCFSRPLRWLVLLVEFSLGVLGIWVVLLGLVVGGMFSLKAAGEPERKANSLSADGSSSSKAS